MAAWGLPVLVWMKPFVDEAEPPCRVDQKPVSIGEPDGAEVTAFSSGWCPAANLVYERARRAADELGPEVRFTSIDTSDHAALVPDGQASDRETAPASPATLVGARWGSAPGGAAAYRLDGQLADTFTRTDEKFSVPWATSGTPRWSFEQRQPNG